MNPDGSYLREFLNQPSDSRATYYAVAANYEPPKGSPLLRVARDGLTEIVFGSTQNDLVVPTNGAFKTTGTSLFPIANPLVFDATRAVDHSSYWPDKDFGSALAELVARHLSSAVGLPRRLSGAKESTLPRCQLISAISCRVGAQNVL